MRHITASRDIGLCISGMVILFILTTVGNASAKDVSLKSLLSKNGISMKLVKVDRMDGFMYGISFKGPMERTVVIAPGFDRKFLVQADGEEVILQADGSGSMRIIQADAVDLSYVLCISSAVIGFFQNWTFCAQGDNTCYITSILTLFTELTACNTGVTP